MNIRNIPTWLGLLAALYLVTACDRVYDDLSGCLGNTIVFSYLADDNQEHLQEYVDDIDVFIFDVGNGALVEKHHLEGEQLLSPLEVRLPEGDYKVVAVGNALNGRLSGMVLTVKRRFPGPNWRKRTDRRPARLTGYTLGKPPSRRRS